MTNPYEKHDAATLRNALLKARRAAEIHTAGGRLYFAELCEKRAEELAAELQRRAEVV